MEAKDTVMTPQQHSLFQKEFMRGQHVHTYADFMIAKQAEISFKAGEEEIKNPAHPIHKAIYHDGYEDGLTQIRKEWRD